MKATSYKFDYPSTLEAEDQFLDDLQQALAENEVGGGPARRLMLALSEAFTNALLHGNEAKPDRRITFRLQVNETMVIADITDEGKGGLDRIKHRVGPSDLLAEGGRGIDLIERSSDWVEFTEEPSGGLKVSISVARKEAQRTSTLQ